MKGQVGVNALVGFAVLLVVAALVAGFLAQIMASMQTSFTTSGVAYNATGHGMNAIANITGQFGNIALVVAAVVIIGLLIAGFAGVGRR